MILIDEENSKYVPEFATSKSGGFDLKTLEDVILPPRYPVKINTGIFIKAAEGPLQRLMITPRSSLALHHSITVLNSPGLVDEDYKQEIAVILINHTSESVAVLAGTKIAQAYVENVVRVPGVQIKVIPRVGGFGSTDSAQCVTECSTSTDGT